MTSIAPDPQKMDGNNYSPRRIVPLRQPVVEEAAAPGAAGPAPQLTYNNGPLLANVRVFTIFWGAAWLTPDSQTLINNLNTYFQFIVASPLIDQLQEYNVNNFQIGHGAFIGTATVSDSEPGNLVTDDQIQAMLQQQLQNNAALPQQDANTLYFVYLPSGTTVEFEQTDSCQVFCGYHHDINGAIFYAVMPFPDCDGCLQDGDVFSSLTVVSSHEMCEAITDPIAGQGWYWFADQNNQGEIGDICAGTTKQVGPYTVQQEWSNAQNSCV